MRGLHGLKATVPWSAPQTTYPTSCLTDSPFVDSGDRRVLSDFHNYVYKDLDIKVTRFVLELTPVTIIHHGQLVPQGPRQVTDALQNEAGALMKTLKATIGHLRSLRLEHKASDFKRSSLTRIVQGYIAYLLRTLEDADKQWTSQFHPSNLGRPTVSNRTDNGKPANHRDLEVTMEPVDLANMDQHFPFFSAQIKNMLDEYEEDKGREEKIWPAPPTPKSLERDENAETHEQHWNPTRHAQSKRADYGLSTANRTVKKWRDFEPFASTTMTAHSDNADLGVDEGSTTTLHEALQTAQKTAQLCSGRPYVTTRILTRNELPKAHSIPEEQTTTKQTSAIDATETTTSKLQVGKWVEDLKPKRKHAESKPAESNAPGEHDHDKVVSVHERRAEEAADARQNRLRTRSWAHSQESILYDPMQDASVLERDERGEDLGGDVSSSSVQATHSPATESHEHAKVKTAEERTFRTDMQRLRERKMAARSWYRDRLRNQHEDQT